MPTMLQMSLRLGAAVLALAPALAKKLTGCFFEFRFPPAMQKEFNGDDRFFPITYKDTWKVVRDIAVGSGTPYNKAAYDAETRRENEALAKKEAEARAKAQQQPTAVPNAPKPQ